MDDDQTPLARINVPELERILGHPWPVLDDGFVRVVDYLGSDQSIVQAARVSYGAGTKAVHEDAGLIRYLMRHRHTTPFEMCEIKLHVRVPMDTWRQWVRHRTACLAVGTRIVFDLPRSVHREGRHPYAIQIEDLYQKFQPTGNRTRPDKQGNPHFNADRVRSMYLRQMNEGTGVIQHTRVVDVYRSGVKPVFRMLLADGKWIECTADHRFKFTDGWKTLTEATGLRLVGARAVWDDGVYAVYVNGRDVSARPVHQTPSWLNEQYNILERKIADIADTAGTSYFTIRKWLAKCGLAHAKGGRRKPAWNKGRRYLLGPRVLSEAFVAANRRARSGAASNFWKGGAATAGASIGRWTAQAARRVHDRNGWTCQLCCQRSPVLHAHHIVPVWADPSRAQDEANLTTLCVSCHRKVNHDERAYVQRLGGPPVGTDWIRRPKAGNKLTVAKLVRIERFEYAGEKETYDVTVEGPYHNFIANGIVTHNSVNEYSTRYSIAIDRAAATTPGGWRRQSSRNKQGSMGFLPEETGRHLTARESALQDLARTVYEERLAAGVAREQARKDLPLSTYTEAYWKINLYNLLHFLSLRMDEHAQHEIRAYANVIGNEIVSRWCPVAWQAFKDYRMNSLVLTALEIEVVRRLASGDRDGAMSLAARYGWLSMKDGKLKRNRERAEASQKLRALGIEPPWEPVG